jgi:hypothetical protein
MKRILIISALAVVVISMMTACKQGSFNMSASNEDTIGFAQFRAWKVMNDQMNDQQSTAIVAKKNSVNSDTGNSGSMSSSSTHQAKTQKKGWSKAAKYAAIGGGGGAILGAVINKRNRVLGAVLGGVLGGGAGYGIGRSLDKKDGRN